MATPHKPSTPPSGNIWPPLLLGARTFLILAMLVSLYLAWVSLSNGRAVGCGPDSGCDRVLQSRWAYWFGIPVSLFALLVDGSLLGWSFRLGATSNPARQQRAWQWILPGAWLILASVLWFVALQLFVVKAICPYCMLSHASAFSAAVLLLRSAPWQSPRGGKPSSGPLSLARSLGVAGAAMTVFVLGQFAYQPATGRMTAAPKASLQPSIAPAPSALHNNSRQPLTGTSVSSGTSAASPAAGLSAGARRMHSVYGRFELNLYEAPLLGAPTNEQVMVSLFDYTCHHCRDMHPVLLEAQRLFSNRLAILSLPMPLDPGCNPTMSRPHPAHTNACEYARLGLTVWRADRSKHQEFDEYLFTGKTPPPLLEAQQRALQLVGPGAFDQATRDPWVEEQLALNVGIYQMAYNSQKGQMPQLILGNSLAMGTYPLEELLQHLATYLGLKRGP